MTQRREFLKMASGAGMVGLSGCNALKNSPTPTQTESPRAASDYLSGQAVNLSKEPLANGTVRILAKPEDSYTAGKETRPHKELGRTKTDKDGNFVFQEFPKEKFETLRSERNFVMIIFRHPNGWFLGSTSTTDLVFDSPSIISTLRPVYKLLVPPTVATDGSGTRRGVVSVWQWFNPKDTTKQRIGVEVSVTNPRTDLSLDNVHSWLNPDTNAKHHTTLKNGMFSLEVPEEGVKIDYNNVMVRHAKPMANVTGKTGTETPLKALEKWHPKRAIQGLELGIPAYFMLWDLYTELSDEATNNAKKRRKMVEVALGATPVVGQVMQAISALSFLFDTDEGTDPSTWATVGNGYDEKIDLNEKDLIKGGGRIESASKVFTIPYQLTNETEKKLAVRGLWSGTLGSAKLGHSFSITNTTKSPTVEDDDQSTQNAKGTFIDDFEAESLDDAWRQFNNKNGFTGRGGFEIQSAISPQGDYALRGIHEKYEKYSGIVRDDFTIDRDNSNLRLYVKLGPVLSGSERANRVHFLGQENPLIKIDQKDRPGEKDGAHIGNGNSENSIMESTTQVEFKIIKFSENKIDEIVVGGNTVATNVDFLNEGSEISSIKIYQGHFAQSSDVIVDGIWFDMPS